MSELLLKGAPVAAAICEKLKSDIGAMPITPRLAIVRVGEKGDDIAYENGAKKRCASVGADVRSVVLPADVPQKELEDVIDCLNRDSSVHGVLLLRPLPGHIDEAAVCEKLLPEKDVDSITSGSLAAVFSGSGAGYPPCTAQACVEMLRHYCIEISGKNVVVIGRSLVIGKPAAMLMLRENATVTICHTKTANMQDICRNTDIIIAAAGKANTVTRDYVSGGQTVLDVGINVDSEGKMCGDVDFDGVEPHVFAISPVPGGVGSVTTAVLISHVVDAAKRALNK